MGSNSYDTTGISYKIIINIFIEYLFILEFEFYVFLFPYTK